MRLLYEIVGICMKEDEYNNEMITDAEIKRINNAQIKVLEK